MHMYQSVVYLSSLVVWWSWRVTRLRRCTLTSRVGGTRGRWLRIRGRGFRRISDWLQSVCALRYIVILEFKIIIHVHHYKIT